MNTQQDSDSEVTEPWPIVILGSGRGSNAAAILEAQHSGRLGRAQVVAVFADSEQAGILQVAQRFGVPARALDPGQYKTRLGEAEEQQWVEQIRALQPKLIVLAGFMRVLKSTFLDAFPNQVINLHPSLLPLYPGLHSIRRAFEDNCSETGCTVHWVTAEVDGGAIIAQSAVPIYATDTLEQVTERVHGAEHQLLPEVIAQLSNQS